MFCNAFNIFCRSTLLALGITMLSQTATAQQIVGNGGIIVTGNCYGTGPVNELLDFYEAKIEYGFTIDLGDVSLPIPEKVELALARLARLDPERAALYRQWHAAFEDESANLPAGVALSSTDDYGAVDRRPDCGVKQAAVQRRPVVTGGKRFFFDPEVVGRLDADNRAGLILHEIIYRDGIRRGHVTSRLVRYLTALLASEDFENLSATDYRARLLETRMNEYRYESLRYFPGLVFDFAEAERFCAGLPGFTTLPEVEYGHIGFSQYATVRASHLGIFIGGTDGLGSAVVWTRRGPKAQLEREILTGDSAQAMAVTGTMCR